MKKFLLSLILVTGLLIAQAGITDYYTFSQGIDAWTPLTGTVLPDLSADDFTSPPLSIGFTFPYGTQSYSNLTICTNGWIGLGPNLTGYSYSNDFSATTLVPILAPLWDDLNLGAGTVKYQLSGSSPNQIFTVEYAGVNWDYSSTSQFSFQVRLYQSGRVEFVYGPPVGAPTAADASIGINMSPGGSGWYYSVTPGSPATASHTQSNNSIAAFPAQGTVYVFNPVTVYGNDLAALSVTGPANPVLGESFQYAVEVRNAGTNAQSAYQVKLYRGADIEIGMAQGTNLAPNATQSFTFTWTPAAAGSETLFGRVFLTGDENAANNQSPGLPVFVQTPGMEVVTVGAGNETARIPLDFYWKNSLYQCIYYASEINLFGTVLGLDFYSNFSDTPTGATRIWLGSTTQTDLAAGMIPSTQLSLVFDGLVNYQPGINTVHIDLQNGFPYLSGNLVMLVQRPFENQYWSSSDVFRVQTIGSNRARKATSDSTVFDPAVPPNTAVLSGQFPKTTFHINTATPADDPQAPSLASALIGCRPNPFHGSVEIRYTLREPARVRVGIYDLRGRRVRTLVDETKATGDHTAVWDGLDEQGLPAASGVYLARLEAGPNSDTLKLIRMQ